MHRETRRKKNRACEIKAQALFSMRWDWKGHALFGSRERVDRERETVEAMIAIFCDALHEEGEGLCAECRELSAYAFERLQKCPFQEGKPTCAKCPVHCYGPEMRGRIKEVMRYAGPRMLLRHPVLALLHVVDGVRRPPERGHRSRQAKTLR
jgi:hypothetical protein